MVDHWAHPLAADVPLVASPMKLSGTPVRKPGGDGLPPPLLGQHTRDVLVELLGHSPQEVDSLRQQGVV
jgi:crotonobetainyl-CoA:carnitine CoA-transferase CaiB-like acyl-CoA transferase